ncbi:MAG: hypothetical protein HOP31_10855 [Ignavibacteria bacterium]|nr:hypothetical protein [Ignavibacteria bacterium]
MEKEMFMKIILKLIFMILVANVYSQQEELINKKEIELYNKLIDLNQDYNQYFYEKFTTPDSSLMQQSLNSVARIQNGTKDDIKVAAGLLADKFAYARVFGTVAKSLDIIPEELSSAGFITTIGNILSTIAPIVPALFTKSGNLENASYFNSLISLIQGGSSWGQDGKISEVFGKISVYAEKIAIYKIAQAELKNLNKINHEFLVTSSEISENINDENLVKYASKYVSLYNGIDNMYSTDFEKLKQSLDENINSGKFTSESIKNLTELKETILNAQDKWNKGKDTYLQAKIAAEKYISEFSAKK